MGTRLNCSSTSLSFCCSFVSVSHFALLRATAVSSECGGVTGVEPQQSQLKMHGVRGIYDSHMELSMPLFM